MICDPAQSAGIGQWGAIQAVAPSVGVRVSPINVSDAGEIERDVAALRVAEWRADRNVESRTGGRHRDLIVTLAARHRCPRFTGPAYFVTAGGFISYGPDLDDQYRRAAGYVDRILKGEKPADLPVQAPTKYELVINLKTANALGLEFLDAACPCRRSDRVRPLQPGTSFAAVHESVSWHFSAVPTAPSNVGYRG